MDVAPGSVDVLGCIDGVLVVDGVGELHVAILADAFLGVDAVTGLDRHAAIFHGQIAPSLRRIEDEPERLGDGRLPGAMIRHIGTQSAARYLPAIAATCARVWVVPCFIRHRTGRGDCCWTWERIVWR